MVKLKDLLNEGKYTVYFDMGSPGLMSKTVDAKNEKEAEKKVASGLHGKFKIKKVVKEDKKKKKEKWSGLGYDSFESIDEVSFSKVSTEKLLRHYKQMADERLSGSAALTFRLIAKELRKRKVRLPEIKEADLGLTYKKGKTVKVKHKTSGKTLVIIDKPVVRKEYEKLGFYAESVNEVDAATQKKINKLVADKKKEIDRQKKVKDFQMKNQIGKRIDNYNRQIRKLRGESVNERRQYKSGGQEMNFIVQQLVKKGNTKSDAIKMTRKHYNDVLKRYKEPWFVHPIKKAEIISSLSANESINEAPGKSGKDQYVGQARVKVEPYTYKNQKRNYHDVSMYRDHKKPYHYYLSIILAHSNKVDMVVDTGTHIQRKAGKWTQGFIKRRMDGTGKERFS